MRIEMRVFGNLREYVKGSEHPLSITVHKGATVLDLLTVAGIPLGKANLIFVNARQVDALYLLREGDRVGIFPSSGGG